MKIVLCSSEINNHPCISDNNLPEDRKNNNLVPLPSPTPTLFSQHTIQHNTTRSLSLSHHHTKHNTPPISNTQQNNNSLVRLMIVLVCTATPPLPSSLFVPYLSKNNKTLEPREPKVRLDRRMLLHKENKLSFFCKVLVFLAAIMNSSLFFASSTYLLSDRSRNHKAQSIKNTEQTTHAAAHKHNPHQPCPLINPVCVCLCIVGRV